MPENNAKDLKDKATNVEPEIKSEVKKIGIIEKIKKLPPIALILLGLAILGVLMLIGVIILFGAKPTNNIKSATAKSALTSMYSSNSNSSGSESSNSLSSSSFSSASLSSSTSSVQVSSTVLSNSSSSIVSSLSSSSSQSSTSSTISPYTISSATLQLITASVSDRNITCNGSFTYKYTATITANGSGTVTYYWFTDDSVGTVGKYPAESVVFTSAGSKQISKDIVVVSHGQGTYVNYPDSQERHELVQIQLFKGTPDIEPAVPLSSPSSVNFYSLCY